MENAIKANFEEPRDYEKMLAEKIYEIIKECSYLALAKYETIFNMKFSCKYWGLDYMNEYYKLFYQLHYAEGSEIEDLKTSLYLLYLLEDRDSYFGGILSYEEFNIFCELLNVIFSDYNPDLPKDAFEISNCKEELLISVIKSVKERKLLELLSEIDFDNELLKDLLSEKQISKAKEKLERKRKSIVKEFL